MHLTFFDLFAGIGGFRLGLERVGFKSVGWCEKDKFAQKSYRAIHEPEGEWFCEDVREVKTEEMPDFDILTAGFPCQAFSVAGKRRGFEDTRGTLFYEIARIVQGKLPKVFVLENVKGLLNHANGETFTIILQTLHEMGYGVEWQVLNSEHFGVPQHRERVFIIGHLGGFSGRKIFPIEGKATEVVGTDERELVNRQDGGIRTRDNFNAVDANYHKGLDNHSARTGVAVSYNRNNGVGAELNTAHTINSSDWRGLNRNQNQNAVVQDCRIRRLTPKECWRLQGFPDWAFGKAKQADISDTQLYRQAGNAVTVNVIKSIGRGLRGVVCTPSS